MKVLTVEGFRVETNLDEQDVFQRMHGDLPPEEIQEEIRETLIYGSNLLDFVEQVGIEGIPVADYFYDNRMGYKDRRLEPWNFRKSKKGDYLVLRYTGSQGGQEWYAKIFIV